MPLVQKNATSSVGGCNGATTSTDVFDFLNHTIAQKSQKSKPTTTTCSGKQAYERLNKGESKSSKRDDRELSAKLVRNQSAIRDKRQQIDKINSSIVRNAKT